jgi:hypothetical protein
MGIDAYLLVEVTHQYDIMSFISELGDESAEVFNQYFSWIGVRSSLKSIHVPLLSVGCGVPGGSSFLGDLIYCEDNESFIAAAHEFQSAPSSIGVRESFADASDEAVSGAGERSTGLVVAIEGDFAGAGDEACMVPDLAFILL